MQRLRQRQKVFHDGRRDELCDLPSRLVHHGRLGLFTAGLFAVSGGVQLRWLEHKDPVPRRNGGLRGRLVMHAMPKRESLQSCRVEYVVLVYSSLHDIILLLLLLLLSITPFHSTKGLWGGLLSHPSIYLLVLRLAIQLYQSVVLT